MLVRKIRDGDFENIYHKRKLKYFAKKTQSELSTGVLYSFPKRMSLAEVPKLLVSTDTEDFSPILSQLNKKVEIKERQEFNERQFEKYGHYKL